MSKFEIDKPDPILIQEIESLARNIVMAIDREDDCGALITQMCQLTQCEQNDKDFFSNLYKSQGIEDFAIQAAYPSPMIYSDIKKDELVEILQLAMSNIESSSFDYYLALFDANVAMPRASNLLFHLPKDWPHQSDNPSPEEIVDFVLSYQVIAL